ncbi:MAG: hypothetical protein CL608_03815 [Anaerolineaceae bacterium]|nr:hypothetical protein [Anaerolineaceae bacterium]
MTIGAALIGIGMLVLAGIVVAQPLRHKVVLPEGSGSDCSSNYDAALLSLRDLEFDHQLDVVSDEDYARTKGQLMTQAAQALEQQVEVRGELDELIETAVRAKRGGTNQPLTCQHCQEQLAPDDNFCPQCGRIAQVNCPVCQQAGTPGDNFCTGCGTSLKDVLHVAGR